MVKFFISFILEIFECNVGRYIFAPIPDLIMLKNVKMCAYFLYAKCID